MVGIEDLDAWNDDGSVEELKAFYCILSNAIQIQILGASLYASAKYTVMLENITWFTLY